MLSIREGLFRKAGPAALLLLVIGCSPALEAPAPPPATVESEPSTPVETETETATPAPAPGASITVDAAKVLREIPRTLYGVNVEWKWNAYMLWQEERGRLDPRLVELTRELGVSLIRFPGGNMSDLYHWRDGVGERSKRPLARHWEGSNNESRPNFGTDEALDFARRTGGELLITVNAATGSAEEAADWVAYVNEDEPRVRYWEIGNEFYIKQKEHAMGPREYIRRFREFAAAMRAADPEIELGAIGGENQGRYAVVGYDDWNRKVLEAIGGEIDFLAVHNAYAPLVTDRQDMATVYGAMLAAPVLIGRNLETLSSQIARYAPRSEIDLAVTEWGPAFQFGFDSPFSDHAKTLGSALYTAGVMNAFLRSPRTTIANHWMLHDISVLGAIGSTNGKPRPEWAPTARYHALQMYTRHFGDRLVAVESDGPTYDSKAMGLVDAVQDVPYLDVVASLGDDGRKLYVLVVNRHFDDAIEARLTLSGFVPDATATAWTLDGRDIGSHTGTRPLEGLPLVEQVTERGFARGGPGEVTLASRTVEGAGPRVDYTFPAHSVTSLVFAAR